jgi:hypothetical protein
MQTVFSHIIQKRFSQVHEDVATDALAFILHSSEAARSGMMKLLRGLVPELPDLRFRTQQTEGSIRPDMCGFAGVNPQVFVENKFWAGLTDNQPVSYLRQLAECVEPTVLLVVGPAAREQTLWRELSRRLLDAGIPVSDQNAPAGIVRSTKTELGPILAITSWTKLLSTLEREAADDPGAGSDLIQLRALCDAADTQAFVPLSASELTDQRTPALILQLSDIVQASVDLAVTEGVLTLDGLRPQASWDRIGRYIRFTHDAGVGAWLGLRFDLWRQHGGLPLWLVFSPTAFGRAAEVHALLDPWAAREGVLSVMNDQRFAVAIDLLIGDEKDNVTKDVVSFLKEIAGFLADLTPKSSVPE